MRQLFIEKELYWVNLHWYQSKAKINLKHSHGSPKMVSLTYSLMKI